ncbi:MAG: LLM class flavin-dependent oxidoreductase [Methanobacteriota archaeon]|nr:MAG: LLM class flavin-dependent oxidoreductase [Euryarchaeota archaeon]
MQSYNVGLTVSADYIPVNKILEMAPLVEKMGYSQVSVPEIWGHDAVTLLANLATRTQKMILSSGILNMYSRTPGVMAMTAASLDELSNGRFTLGLGLSGPAVVENFHGKKFEKPLTHTKDFISMVRMLLSGKRMDYSSETLGKVKGFKLSMKLTRTDLPIHLAALGPKNVKLTARIADGWIPVIMPLEAFQQEVEKIHGYLNEYGRDKGSFEITPFVLCAVSEDETAMDYLRGHLAYYFGGMGTFYNNMLKRVGFEDEARQIMLRWKNGDRKGAAAAVTDGLLEQTCVFGTPKEARNKMMKIINAGGTRPLVSLPFGSPENIVMDTLQSLAPNSLHDE